MGRGVAGVQPPGLIAKGPARLTSVCINRFESLSYVLDPPGHRGPAPGLQKRSRRSRNIVARERIGELPTSRSGVWQHPWGAASLV
jgi:hypothetical protein